MPASMLTYREFTVPRELGAWVACLWRLHGPAGLEADVQRVLPDGCPEIVIHRRDPFLQRLDDGAVRRQATVMVAGQLRKAIVLTSGPAADVWGIRLHPWGLRVALDAPACELTDRLESGCDLTPALAAALRDAVFQDHEPVEDALIDVLRAFTRALAVPDHGVVAAVRALAARHGHVRVDALARQAGVSGRQLERRFQTTVGVGPKTLARILRLQHVLAALQSGSGDELAVAAVDCGYCDQSHLARDVRSIAGETPGTLRLLDLDLGEPFFRARRMSVLSKTWPHGAATVSSQEDIS
jgi:AraC-like DNA-binding protein